jgi:hypothetical protein
MDPIHLGLLEVEVQAQWTAVLRAFRHFFRHSYGRRLDRGRVLSVLDQAREAVPLLQRDIIRFLSRLGASLQS